MTHEDRKIVWVWLGGDACFVPSDDYLQSFLARLMDSRFENAGPVEAGRLEEELLCGYEIADEAIDLMLRSRNPFTQNLARLYRHADLENKMYIVRGLSHAFDAYIEAAKQIREAA